MLSHVPETPRDFTGLGLAHLKTSQPPGKALEIKYCQPQTLTKAQTLTSSPQISDAVGQEKWNQ